MNKTILQMETYLFTMLVYKHLIFLNASVSLQDNLSVGSDTMSFVLIELLRFIRKQLRTRWLEWLSLRESLDPLKCSSDVIQDESPVSRDLRKALSCQYIHS